MSRRVWGCSIRSLFGAVTAFALVAVLLSRNGARPEPVSPSIARQRFAGTLIVIRNFGFRGERLAGNDRSGQLDDMSFPNSWRYQVTAVMSAKLGPTPPREKRCRHILATSLDYETHPFWTLVDGVIRDSQARKTRIVAVVGAGSLYASYAGGNFADGPDAADTIALIEGGSFGPHWSCPGDFDLRTLPQLRSQGTPFDVFGTYYPGIHVGFADGEVWLLSQDVPWEVIVPFFTVEGAQQFDRTELLTPYRLQ